MANSKDIIFYHYRTIWHKRLCDDIVDNINADNSNLMIAKHMQSVLVKKYKFLYGDKVRLCL